MTAGYNETLAAQPETVLVVDANDFERQTYVDLLKANGFRVITASNLEEAEDVRQSSPVALIVLDLFFRQRGEVLQALATLRNASSSLTPIVLVTAGMGGDFGGWPPMSAIPPGWSSPQGMILFQLFAA
jgi:CheY-like chemotaxis protein